MRGSMNDIEMTSYAKDDISGQQSGVANRYVYNPMLYISSTIPGNGGLKHCGGISNNKHYINNTQRQIKFRINQQPQGVRTTVQHSEREVYQSGISVIEQNTLLGQLNLPTIQQMLQSLTNR